MNTSEPRGHRPPLPPDALGRPDTSPAELRTLDRHHDPLAPAAESYNHLRRGLGTSEIPRLLGFYDIATRHLETLVADGDTTSDAFDQALAERREIGDEIAGLLLRRWHEITAPLLADNPSGYDLFR